MFNGTRPVRRTLSERALCCLLLMSLVLGAGLVLAGPEPVGKVEWLQGSVTVAREGFSGPAAVGDPVYLHDKWQTQEDGGAELIFADDSRVRMGPRTFLEITEYLYQPQEKSRDSLISMMAGKARFVVQDLQDYKEKRFRVQTQTAVVGTRGTEFIVAIDPVSGSTRALSIANNITFAPVNAPQSFVVLAPNTTSVVQPNVPPTAPSVAPPAVRQELMKGVERTLPADQAQAQTGGSAKTEAASEQAPPTEESQKPAEDKALKTTNEPTETTTEDKALKTATDPTVATTGEAAQPPEGERAQARAIQTSTQQGLPSQDSGSFQDSIAKSFDNPASRK